MWRKWTFFFRVIGMNSITIYVGSGIINFTNATNFFFTGFSSLFPGDWSVLVMRLGRVIVAWLFLYFLYRKNTFLKV
jgi:predicted acyltransferase